MVKPQPTDAHIRIPHQISEQFMLSQYLYSSLPLADPSRIP